MKEENLFTSLFVAFLMLGFLLGFITAEKFAEIERVTTERIKPSITVITKDGVSDTTYKYILP